MVKVGGVFLLLITGIPALVYVFGLAMRWLLTEIVFTDHHSSGAKILNILGGQRASVYDHYDMASLINPGYNFLVGFFTLLALIVLLGILVAIWQAAYEIVNGTNGEDGNEEN